MDPNSRVAYLGCCGAPYPPAVRLTGRDSKAGTLVVRHPIFLVIVAWVVLAATLFLTLPPPLMEVAERKPPGLLPDSSSVMVAGNEMGEAFAEGAGSGNSGNVGAIIFANEDGLTPPDDEATYRKVVDRLKADPEHVLSTQDFVSIPELKQVMTSEDKKAWQLPISMQGTMGTGGEGQRAYKAVLKEVKEATEVRSSRSTSSGPRPPSTTSTRSASAISSSSRSSPSSRCCRF